MATMMRTALVRISNNVHRIIREDDWSSQKDFAANLRGNGYRVLKIWNGYISDDEVSDWQWLNRNPRDDNHTDTNTDTDVDVDAEQAQADNNIFEEVSAITATAKFEVGKTYFVNFGNQPCTVEVTNRTQDKLTVIIYGNVRQFVIHGTPLGEYINVYFRSITPSRILAANEFKPETSNDLDDDTEQLHDDCNGNDAKHASQDGISEMLYRRYKALRRELEYSRGRDGKPYWFSYGSRISTRRAEEILAKYGFTVATYLGNLGAFEDMQWQMAMLTVNVKRKIKHDRRRLDNDNVFDLIPNVDELNNVDDAKNTNDAWWQAHEEERKQHMERRLRSRRKIEVVRAPDVKTIINTIDRLNYLHCTFSYQSSAFDGVVEYRHFYAYNQHRNLEPLAIDEIIANGRLAAVRFSNYFRNIFVDFVLTDFTPDHSGFDNIINVDMTNSIRYTIKPSHAVCTTGIRANATA